VASCGSCQCHAWKITIRICELFSSLFCCCCFPNLPSFLHVLFFLAVFSCMCTCGCWAHFGFSFLGGSFCNMYIWEQVSSFQRSFFIFGIFFIKGSRIRCRRGSIVFLFLVWNDETSGSFSPLFENFRG